MPKGKKLVKKISMNNSTQKALRKKLDYILLKERNPEKRGLQFRIVGLWVKEEKGRGV